MYLTSRCHGIQSLRVTRRRRIEAAGPVCQVVPLYYYQHCLLVQVEPTCSALVYNTLLELYLHDLARESDITRRVERQRKTLDMLQNQSVRSSFVGTVARLCWKHAWQQQ